jgi:hypothetical protein
MDLEEYVAALDEFAVGLDVALEKVQAFKDAHPLPGAENDGAVDPIAMRLYMALQSEVDLVEHARDGLRRIADVAAPLVRCYDRASSLPDGGAG